MDRKVTLEMIQEARDALQGVTELTPMVSSNRLGKNLYIKSENLQKTGSFKIRGAFNKIRKLSPEEAAKGVIACSAGNHAQGVALSATRLGIKSVICMPEGAPLLKVEATRGYGAEVVLVPGPKFTQTHVHLVSDAILPSHPLSSPSPSINLSQHQGLFQ